MRILFTCAGGSGHFHPLAPVARAAAAAGHAVAFAGRPSTVPAIAAAGFRAFATGRDPGSMPEGAALQGRYRALPTIAEREALLLREGFAGLAVRYRLPDLLDVCAAWRPDLLVRDELAFGGAIAAERLALPHAAVLVMAAGSLLRRDLVAPPLNALRAEHGLAPDPELRMLDRSLVLSPFPPRFRDPAVPAAPTTSALRPLGLDGAGGAELPPWAAAPPAPTVYCSFGTSCNSRRQDLFAPVIAGLRELPITLIVTVGRDLDPAAFGDQPANVRIARYIPQSALLPHCALVVTHGGSGSVMGALSHGLPLVAIPLGADQEANAERCAALGVGPVIAAGAVTREAVREAALAALADSSYRRNAERLRDEIAALPGPEHAVALLERLARETRPILSEH